MINFTEFETNIEEFMFGYLHQNKSNRLKRKSKPTTKGKRNTLFNDSLKTTSRKLKNASI